MIISENSIQQVREADLINIIGQYVKLKRSGNQYLGLCPFHNEHTPSFYVSPAKGYYCFGCDAKGSNVIDFIMEYEGKEFPDAVIHVAGMAGIIIDEGVHIKPALKQPQQPLPQRIDYIPYETVSRNLKAYQENNLFKFFTSLFGKSTAGQIFQKYGVGSSWYYGSGTTSFIQKDIDGNIRQVKVIMYDDITGKRLKDKKCEPKIIGRELAGYDKSLSQCFFGEHLLKGDNLPIAIVESEKTACICSISYPQFLWIATGGKNGCNMKNPDVNKVLEGKEIHLFPDVDGMNDWRNSATELKAQGFDVFLNDVMGQIAEPGSKDDIADLILINRADNGILLNDNDYPVIWDNTYLTQPIDG